MNMANMSTTSPLHFLLLPVPGQGHLNPMLALAENLRAEGCTITVVLPEQSHRKILAAAAAAPASHDLHGSLHFVTFNAAEFSDLAGMMTVFKQQQGFLENLIESSKSTPTPISCIVSDFMFTWAQDVANKCGIPRALFWLCSATIFHIGTVARAAGGLYPGAPQLKELQQKLHVSARAMLEAFDPEDPAEKETRLGFFDRWDEPSYILINTIEALEGHVVPLLPSNARFIGPCLRPADAKMALSSVSDNGNHHQCDAVHQPEAPAAVAARFGSLAKEDMACLSWLDQQEDSSVLYISFGSVATLPAAQLVEMALGIEASNHKFLWVAREGPINTDASTASTFPEGFLQRTRERGMVTSWAPQLQVLKHRAVGGFLTHCGWNSTMESIVMGVPMLCFPFFGDQPINEEIIMGAGGVRQVCMKNDEGQEEGKEALAVPAAAGGRPMSLGFGFEGRRNTSPSERKSNYVVSREEVERAVRALLGDGSSDENHADVKVMRENARHLMGHARRALHHDSHATLRSFIQDIRHLTTTRSTTVKEAHNNF